MQPCTCKHGNPSCILCYATQRLCEKDELIEAMAELTDHEFETLMEVITSTDDHMLPSLDQSRQTDPPNGAIGGPFVNSCDPHDSGTKVPPDKSVNPLQPQIFSELNTSVLGKVHKIHCRYGHT